MIQQECIPVGCVPSAAVAVSRGVYLVPGGGVPSPGGCTWYGVSTLGGPGPRGVYLVQGGGVCSGGVPGPRGVYLVRGCT